MMTEEEHLRYHLEVSLDCGQCTFEEALAMHFRALTEVPPYIPLPPTGRMELLDDEDLW